MLSAKLAGVCGSFISSGSLLLIYTEGVSILNIFIRKYILLALLPLACLLVSFIFILAVGNLGEVFRCSNWTHLCFPNGSSIMSVFCSLSLYLLSDYGVHGIVILIAILWIFRENKEPQTFAMFAVSSDRICTSPCRMLNSNGRWCLQVSEEPERWIPDLLPPYFPFFEGICLYSYKQFLTEFSFWRENGCVLILLHNRDPSRFSCC